MKPGTIFEHKHFLDLKKMPLLCKVFDVRNGVVYWRHWGIDMRNKGRFMFDLKDARKHVGQIIDEVKS